MAHQEDLDITDRRLVQLAYILTLHTTSLNMTLCQASPEILTKSSNYRGQGDFKSVYQETSLKGLAEDQTHHYAAYFGLGTSGLGNCFGNC